MNNNDFFDEDYDFDADELFTQTRRLGRLRRNDEDQRDKDHEFEKRNRKKERWRDIEERLFKKALSRENDWTYGDYDF